VHALNAVTPSGPYTGQPTVMVAALLARVAAFGPVSDAVAGCGPDRTLATIPAQSRSREDAPARPRDPERPPARPAPSSGSFAALGYALFTLQQPGSLSGMPSLEQALAAPRTGRHDEHRGTGPRVDAFAMMGEIGFLDI
jgi:hypothetical protein